MGRIYVAKFTEVAVSAAQDLFEIAAPATGIVKIHEWVIGQNTDVGDAAEELLRIEEVRGDGTVTSGSGGTTVTPQPIDNGDGAASSTVEANNTTRMVVGTGVLDELQQYTWNVRIGHEKIYVPESRPVIAPSDRWTLALDDTPADPITVSGHVIFEEIGG